LKKDHPLFKGAIFRSPEELLSLASMKGIVKTAIHFQKEDDPQEALEIERKGRERGENRGAFVAVQWEKS